GQQPGHVRLVDGVEQAQHQAVDGDGLDAQVHAGSPSSASRMRRTAATELALSPCTHRLSARRTRALPLLAVSGLPPARASAWAITCSLSWCTAPGRLRATRNPSPS